MKLGDLICSEASSIPFDTARLDVELLMSYILKCSRSYLYTQWNQTLTSREISKFQSVIRLRSSGVPIAYIIGKKEFYSYEFQVEPGVFIPRPETEVIVSAVKKQFKQNEKLNIIDFGCGSGCLGLSLLNEWSQSRLICVDVSRKALQVAKKNAKAFCISDRVFFLRKDVYYLKKEDWNTFMSEEIDLIVANPPYVAFKDPKIQKEVLCFEPFLSLFSPDQGLCHLRSWLHIASRLLKPNGLYFFEIGAEQETACTAMKIPRMVFSHTLKDLSNLTRVICFQRNDG